MDHSSSWRSADSKIVNSENLVSPGNVFNQSLDNNLKFSSGYQQSQFSNSPSWRENHEAKNAPLYPPDRPIMYQNPYSYSNHGGSYFKPPAADIVNDSNSNWQQNLPEITGENIKDSNTEIVGSMVPIAAQNLQANNNNAALLQHEHMPVLVPNPHYNVIKQSMPQHGVLPTQNLQSNTIFQQSSHSQHLMFSSSNHPSGQFSYDISQQHLSQPNINLSQSYSNQEKHSLMATATVPPNGLPAPTASKSKSNRGNRCYQCPKCVKVFRRGDHLKRHLLSVHDHEHPYQCGECGKGFANVGALAKHSKSLHLDVISKGHLCLRCKLPFTSMSELEVHANSLHMQEDKDYMQSINSSSKQHPCSYCSKCFTSLANVKRHIQLLHRSNGNMKFTCDLCEKSFTRGDNLRKHKEKEHPKVEPVQHNKHAITPSPPKTESMDVDVLNKGPFINKSNSQLTNIKVSTKEEQNHNIKSDKTVTEKCSDKEKSFGHKKALAEIKDIKPLTDVKKKQHVDINKTKFVPVDQKSDFSAFYTPPSSVSEAVSIAMKTLSYFAHDEIGPPEIDGIILSLNTSHNEPDSFQQGPTDTHTTIENKPQLNNKTSFLLSVPPPIKMMKESFNSMIQLNHSKLPLMRDGGGVNLPLNDAKYSNIKDSKLMNNNSVADSDKICCTKCGIKYKNIEELMQHLETKHLKKEPNKCCICSKYFAQAGNVKRHIRCVHLRERPFSCSKCSSTFDRLCYLQRHLRSHEQNGLKIYNKKGSQLHSQTQCMTNQAHSTVNFSKKKFDSIGNETVINKTEKETYLAPEIKLPSKYKKIYFMNSKPTMCHNKENSIRIKKINKRNKARKPLSKRSKVKKYGSKLYFKSTLNNKVLLPFKCYYCNIPLLSLPLLRSHLLMQHNIAGLKNICKMCGRYCASKRLLKYHQSKRHSNQLNKIQNYSSKIVAKNTCKVQKKIKNKNRPNLYVYSRSLTTMPKIISQSCTFNTLSFSKPSQYLQSAMVL